MKKRERRLHLYTELGYPNSVVYVTFSETWPENGEYWGYVKAPKRASLRVIKRFLKGFMAVSSGKWQPFAAITWEGCYGRDRDEYPYLEEDLLIEYSLKLK